MSENRATTMFALDGLSRPIVTRFPADSPMNQTFSSPEAAVSFTRDHAKNRVDRARADSKLLRGAIVSTARWASRSLVLCFEDGRELRMFLDGTVVDWRIADQSEETFEPVGMLYAEEYQFAVINKEGNQITYSWCPGNEVQQFIGRSLTFVSANTHWFFFAFANAESERPNEIMVDAIECVESGELILKWGNC